VNGRGPLDFWIISSTCCWGTKATTTGTNDIFPQGHLGERIKMIEAVRFPEIVSIKDQGRQTAAFHSHLMIVVDYAVMSPPFEFRRRERSQN
jgi:hypothetical protein